LFPSFLAKGLPPQGTNAIVGLQKKIINWGDAVLNLQDKGYLNDYRVNFLNNSTIISIEITCCGKHIGEMRFKDGERKKCPHCGLLHTVTIQHNHFHIRPVKADFQEQPADARILEEKAL
jgi:phage FluMu protein Com